MQTVSSPLCSGTGGNGAKAYRCSFCISVITYSDRQIAVSDSKRHTFINPAGISCEFYTFSSCPGAITFGYATEEHTWFPGYIWSLALCRHCSTHLGWHYQSVTESEELTEFWGILVNQILAHQG